MHAFYTIPVYDGGRFTTTPNLSARFNLFAILLKSANAPQRGRLKPDAARIGSPAGA